MFVMSYELILFQYRNKDFSSKYKLNTTHVSAVLPTRSKPEHPHPGPITPEPANTDSVRAEEVKQSFILAYKSIFNFYHVTVNTKL